MSGGSVSLRFSLLTEPAPLYVRSMSERNATGTEIMMKENKDYMILFPSPSLVVPSLRYATSHSRALERVSSSHHHFLRWREGSRQANRPGTKGMRKGWWMSGSHSAPSSFLRDSNRSSPRPGPEASIGRNESGVKGLATLATVWCLSARHG